MNFKKTKPIWRSLTSIMLSLMTVSVIGYGIADDWRGQVDAALGTSSYLVDSSNVAYKSTYSTGEELMNAAKEIAVREGAEGTVIMKNENNALPLVKGSTVALFGGAAYRPYMSAAGNSDQVKLADALTDAGFEIDGTVKGIYDNLLTNSKYIPNTAAGDYTSFKIKEANPSVFMSDGGASVNWKSSVKADVALVVISRPGGESTTYKPGSAYNTDGVATGKDPLALSDDELAVIDTANEVCEKVIVLLNTSCTIEIGELKNGAHEVDGIAYIGIPNDYQFTGIVKALDGDVNPSGALADTYATSSVSSPAMMNFGSGTYSDYTLVNTNADGSPYIDKNWGTQVEVGVGNAYGNQTCYAASSYYVEAESIYTEYYYYETRYYDGIVNPDSGALSSAGVYASSGNKWNYNEEVSYSFGWGLSYLEYEQELVSVEVEDRVGGNVTAKINVTNKGDKSGLFLAQLYVQTPYTQYDKTNKVEKSAVMFLSSGKVEVGAGKTEQVTVTVPVKYLASYDYTNAKTYIMDGGNYYFATGNGSHEALNNILAAQGYGVSSGMSAEGDEKCVKIWNNGSESDTDVSTYSISDNGSTITNVADNADLNYYLPGTVTYLSRSDWKNTWPKNYNDEVISLAASAKSSEWIKELRNQQYDIKTDNPVENVDGLPGTTFADIKYEHQNNFDDPFWDELTDAISLDQAVGAVAHGGSQSDTLDNVNNPVVVQYDGPRGFNSQTLSTNNGNPDEDPYYVDPNSEAGKFLANINSQSLLGSSFNPELANDWGKVLGNTGIWISCFQIWGAALNVHRTPYNGRNTEYLSEDPMLSNVLGAEFTKGTREFGIISGPKHIGFNDQEYQRSGVSVYLNEQKMRETDLRGFQGSVEEGGALAMMVAFNRIGAVNASHHVGMLKNIVRNEWGFKGIISTDMMSNEYYFNAESCIMATVTQMADFAGNNSTLGGANGKDATWSYLSVKAVMNDNDLVIAARECMKYQLYAFSNSIVLNVSTMRVTPWWEAALIAVTSVTAVLSAASAVLFVTSALIKDKKEAE